MKLKLNKKIIFQELNGKLVALNILNGKFYEINDIGQVIIEELEKNIHTKISLRNKLKKNFTSSFIENDFYDFLEKLEKNKFFE